MAHKTSITNKECVSIVTVFSDHLQSVTTTEEVANGVAVAAALAHVEQIGGQALVAVLGCRHGSDTSMPRRIIFRLVCNLFTIGLKPVKTLVLMFVGTS